MPREMTIDDIDQVVEDFGACALRAKKAGFDGVEVHLAHGYLLFEFLSPHVNKRTDKYGGCFKNRARIVKELYENIRSKVGEDFLITCRLSARDGYYGGRDVYDSMELAMYVEELGFQAINVSSGSYGDHGNYDIDIYKHGFTASDAGKIKSVVNIPVIATNRIPTAGVAEAILKTGEADLIGMGRTSLADPHFPNKVKDEKEESVRHCINCNIGCYGELLAGRCGSCLVNPTVGKEIDLDSYKSKKSKTIFIAGGGPGGMQAAITATELGHKAVLFEAGGQLGGQFVSAAFPPGKGELSLFTTWLNRELKEKEIETRLNISLTKEIVMAEKPDAVILATGGRPAIPPIKGIDGKNVYTAEDVLVGKVPTGDNVVVCGGGEVGTETAVAVAFRGNGKVTIVEMLENIFADLQYKKLIHEYDIDVNTETKVLEITKEHVIVEKNGKKVAIPAETVILAFGYTPNNRLAEELKDLCEVKIIGGAVKTGNAFEATRDAFNAILEL